MNQLDRIEAKLDVAIELLLMEPLFIKVPHEKHPEREWDKVAKLRHETVEKLKTIYEDTNNFASESREVS